MSRFDAEVPWTQHIRHCTASLHWSPVGLHRWLVDVVVSGRLSWLDAKTIGMGLVDNIAAGSRYLAVSLGEGGRMVTLIPVD